MYLLKQIENDDVSYFFLLLLLLMLLLRRLLKRHLHLFGPTCGQPSYKNGAARQGNTMAVKDGESKKNV